MKKIVLLGDSIRLIGYGAKVPELLGDQYEVWQPEDNCRFASYTLRMLFDHREQIKGADVIHWNNGLWDECDLFGDGAFTPIEEYCDTMERIAKILMTYGKTVVFATTTPTHPAMWGQSRDRIVAYNEAVVARLSPMGIKINDLFSAIDADVERYICGDLIHLSDEGVEVASAKVAECIMQYA